MRIYECMWDKGYRDLPFISRVKSGALLNKLARGVLSCDRFGGGVGNQVLGTFMLVLLHVELHLNWFLSCLSVNIFLLVMKSPKLMVHISIFLWLDIFKFSSFCLCFCSIMHFHLSCLYVSAVVITMYFERF